MSTIRFKTLRENVLDEIRSKIINRELKQGARILEQELAEEFGVSRGPIREALRQLEQEGLVEYTRNAGCRVREISARDIFEIYFLRGRLESLSVEIAGGVPDEDIQKLESITEEMQHLNGTHFEAIYSLDEAFHETIVSISHMPRIYKAWKELSYGNRMIGSHEKLDHQELIDRQYHIHREILDVIRKGQTQEICAALVAHYKSSICALMDKIGVEIRDVCCL